MTFHSLKWTGHIITNIRPTKFLRLLLGLIFETKLAKLKLKDQSCMCHVRRLITYIKHENKVFDLS